MVNEKHLRKRWPELLSDPTPFVPEARPERIVSGLDCWPLLTWARLSAVECPFDVRLATRAVDGAVCLFHWDDAVPRLGVHRCFAVVVQADRPDPALADMTVVQNGLEGEGAYRRYIPLWTQPGLVPRDPGRGDTLRTLAYLGSDQYEPHFVKSPAFRSALRERGVTFVNRFQGWWHDYREIDAVLAVRDCPPVVLATKPASKLVNAWTAGVARPLGAGTRLRGTAALAPGLFGDADRRKRSGRAGSAAKRAGPLRVHASQRLAAGGGLHRCRADREMDQPSVGGDQAQCL